MPAKHIGYALLFITIIIIFTCYTKQPLIIKSAYASDLQHMFG